MIDSQISNVLVDRMNHALKELKSQTKDQRKKSMVETTQVVDGQVSVIFEQKNMVKMNKELVLNYFSNMQLNHLIKRNKRE